MSNSEYYHRQIAGSSEQVNKAAYRSGLLATGRAGLFIAWISIFLILINAREMQWAILVSLAFLVCFSLVVKHHNRIKFRKRQYQNIVDINRLELARQNADFRALDEGREYIDNLHPYTSDLDVFGKSSLFQLINRTTSIIGRHLLVERLKTGLPAEAIVAHQQAVKALSEDPEWAQSYQALGQHYKTEELEFRQFENWRKQPPVLNLLAWLRPVTLILPVLLVAATTICAVTGITYYAVLPFILVNALLLTKFWKYATKTVDQTYKSVNLLKTLGLQMNQIEKKVFTDPLLQELARPFQVKDQNVSSEIKRLTFLLNQLQTRGNMLHIFFNIAFLLDIQWLIQLEKWHVKNAEHAGDWFDRLAEFEVLISLSGTAFGNQGWSFAVPGDIDYHVEARGLGHPMLATGSAVTNKFAMQGKGEVILITGPNMAGKSTFLRTVAVNIVLARMGAPVFADFMQLNLNVQVFTAMRVADDLSENVSSFYAELQRIQQLLETISTGTPVIYFLDEILKGTNSADRHRGAEGLIKQLSELGVSGFVSTHDLELGDLATQMNKLTNYSFESMVEDDEIVFDYKLRTGVCHSFNACELMRKMGIDV
jgi:DNA mismatch repair ATPase MutS